MSEQEEPKVTSTDEGQSDSTVGLGADFERELRAMINPQYEDCRGTESYERKRLLGEIDRLRDSLSVAKQALLEVRHAQTCGSEWYTRGASGLYQQVSTWVNRGLDAIKSVEVANDLELTGAASPRPNERSE